MNNEEVLALLEEANNTTNEIAADIQDLINNNAIHPEVAEKLAALAGRLKDVAAVHTPAPTPEPIPEPPV